jgi:hypothetical protein
MPLVAAPLKLISSPDCPPLFEPRYFPSTLLQRWRMPQDIPGHVLIQRITLANDSFSIMEYFFRSWSHDCRSSVASNGYNRRCIWLGSHFRRNLNGRPNYLLKFFNNLRTLYLRKYSHRLCKGHSPARLAIAICLLHDAHHSLTLAIRFGLSSCFGESMSASGRGRSSCRAILS